MHLGRPMEDFGRTAPDHRQPGRPGVLLEPADVVHQHLGVIHLRAFRLEVRTIDALYIITVENRRHGLDLLQRTTQALDQWLIQYARMQCGFVAVLLEDIPAAEFQILQRRQRHEVA
jgi:hypothetical protein